MFYGRLSDVHMPRLSAEARDRGEDNESDEVSALLQRKHASPFEDSVKWRGRIFRRKLESELNGVQQIAILAASPCLRVSARAQPKSVFCRDVTITI